MCPSLKDTCHEEADTLLCVHVLDIIKCRENCEVDIKCKDTDVFVYLTHLKASCQDRFTLQMIAGTIAKPKNIYINDVVTVLGQKKSKALIGLHCFSGADWGGRFFGISKQRWFNTMINKDDDDELIQCLSLFGEEDQSEDWEVAVLEKFVCEVYCPSLSTQFSSVNKIRFYLFRTKGSEGENLPPTKGALMQHIKRARIMSTIALSYKQPYPSLPILEGNGWVKQDGKDKPHTSDLPPAPEAILELIKCGCKGACTTNRCACHSNNMACCNICKCGDECSNDVQVYGPRTDEDESI